MPLSPAERVEFEQNCFGCTEAESVAGIDHLVSRSLTHYNNNANVALMSILSDAQELMAMGRINDARQYLNRVKHALSEAAPMRLWQMESVRNSHEVAHECSEAIRLAARNFAN